MADPISTFFDAWQLDSADARHEKIAKVVTAKV